MSEKEGVSSAVLAALQERGLLHLTALDVWIGKGRVDEAALRENQERIDAVRKWAATLPHGLVRSEYFGWLNDYYEHGMRDAWNELRTGRLRREHEANDARLERTRQAEAVASKTLPRPPMDEPKP